MRISLLALLLTCTVSAPAQQAVDEARLSRLLSDLLIIDTHIDTPRYILDEGYNFGVRNDYYETDIRPGEVLTEIVIPAQPARAGWAYTKFLPRTADDYATVSVACVVSLEDGSNRCREARVALGSAGTTPIRAEAVEAALRGQELTPQRLREAAQQVEGLVDPISDFRGSADYKREMAVVWTRRALEQAIERARAGS